MLRDMGFVREQLEMRYHEPESHQSDAGANPREKRSLFRKIIPQISDRPSFDGGIHFDSTHDWLAHRRPSGGRERASYAQCSRHTGNDLTCIDVFAAFLPLIRGTRSTLRSHVEVPAAAPRGAGEATSGRAQILLDTFFPKYGICSIIPSESQSRTATA